MEVMLREENSAVSYAADVEEGTNDEVAGDLDNCRCCKCSGFGGNNIARGFAFVSRD